MTDASASQQIDAIVEAVGGWRGKTMSRLRVVIKKADTGVAEEVKWKKPSRPAGVPVWSHDGILCVGEPLKNAVRLTFPKGAMLKDPKRLFNARLTSNSVRAIDVYESVALDEGALKALVLDAVRVNSALKRRSATTTPRSPTRQTAPARQARRRD